MVLVALVGRSRLLVLVGRSKLLLLAKGTAVTFRVQLIN
jgi:hypothetical protein